MGQGPVITSFQGNGQLSWTNVVNSNALYRVEWAAQADGPWQRNFDNIGSMDGRSATAFTVSVPMFYRLVMATNPPPTGMVWIDGGDVELGQTGIETPVHTNFISGFWMDENEVTYGKWKEVYSWAITNGYTFDNAGSGKTNNHPVQTVNWYDCVKWCNARSQKEGLTPCYYIDPIYFNLYKTGDMDISNAWVNWSANGYRLPTDAEWEKAARGGRQRRLFPWGGDTIQHARANYNAATNLFGYDTSPTQGHHPDFQTEWPYTSPVGCFPGNGYGLHDMAGNVFEWCWDWSAGYSASYQTDPRGPVSGTQRVVRGGSWNYYAFNARCAYRAGGDPDFEIEDRGFRCARGI
jgi:formylglycine-generating enzyme required for sulfatase activity